MRHSGILLHISSLPSPYGIGTFGKAAYEFADFLHAAGQHYWQLLPIGPTGYGDSPYQSASTFAGNPYFIDLDLLVEDGLLTQEEIDAIPWAGHTDRVDYGFQYEHRYALLRKAFERGWERDSKEIEPFVLGQPWLFDYVVFMAVKASQGGACWNTWPEDIRLRQEGAIFRYAEANKEEVHFYTYLQFLFFKQWNALRDYVHGLGIQLIGDLPIYVPYDSCDVWANTGLFQLDGQGNPTAVAGCPPDAFSAVGQLWGNPIYDWGKMGETGYAWWNQRISGAAKLFDVIRIDHFRGLESYWSIPYGDTDARGGHWEKGPDHDFVKNLHEQFPDLMLIAEDLGYLTEEVKQLREDSGYPGMKVLEFAFDPREPGNYLPHGYDFNCICYTGTHDNETLVQFLDCAPEEVRAFTREYLGMSPEQDMVEAILRAGMASTADTFIAQLQDYLHLGAEARMNKPGSLSTDNWTWRLQEIPSGKLAQKIARMVSIFER